MSDQKQLTISQLTEILGKIREQFGDLPVRTEDRYADSENTDERIVAVWVNGDRNEIVLVRAGDSQYLKQRWRITYQDKWAKDNPQHYHGFMRSNSASIIMNQWNQHYTYTAAEPVPDDGVLFLP